MEKNCAKCGAAISDGAKFCMKCGSPAHLEPGTAMYCMHCGAAVPTGAKFCLRCGKPTDISAVETPINAVTADENHPPAVPATVEPVEIPKQARTADMIRWRYRSSKAVRNVLLSIPIVTFLVVVFTYMDGILPVLSDIRDFIVDGNIRDGFVITVVTILLTVPYWIISEAVIRNRRHKAIRMAGMDSLQFGAALHQYEELRREGKLRPVADPGPIPKDVITAVAIQNRYRTRAVTSYVVFITLWILFISSMTVIFRLDVPHDVVTAIDDNASYIFGFVLLYTICHFAVIIPVLRRKRKKSFTQAGFDKNRYLELLYQHKTLKREKRQWAAQESARKLREETQQAAERLAAAEPVQRGRNSRIWFIGVLLVAVLIFGLYYSGAFHAGSTNASGKKTIEGLYIDSEGMRRLTFNLDLEYPPDLILFTSGGDVYFSQYKVVNSDAEMMKYGEHYKYTISGNTITIDGNTAYTGTINGSSINLVGKTFVPGVY